jgi:tetratricopeptide (TPR) repeat protein
MKHKADELLQNKNYWAAIIEYERILSIRQSSKLKVDFYAMIWNNLGGCYARLFLFEKAASCYENAYQFQKIADYKEKAHYARKLAGYGQEELEELLESKLSEEFVKEAESILANLEEKSKQECKEILPEDFLKMCEK